MEYEIYKDGELYHWGVRGMRWGVRRYQNKDGSLTDRGKKRLRAEQAKVREEEKTLKNRQSVKARLDRLEARKKAVEEGKKELDEAKNKAKAERKATRDAKKSKKNDSKKSPKDMTDEELAAAINRARLEDQYNQLRPTVEKQSFMKKMVNEAVKPALISSGKRFLENAINKAADNLLKGKEDPNSIEALKKVHDKLDMQNKIEKIQSEMNKRKKGIEDDNMSWDEKLKKQQWEKNERERKEKEQQEKIRTEPEFSKDKKQKTPEPEYKKQKTPEPEYKKQKTPEPEFYKDEFKKKKIIDIVNDNNTSSGQSFVSKRLTTNTSQLALPSGQKTELPYAERLRLTYSRDDD